jgi:hypothetical protein
MKIGLLVALLLTMIALGTIGYSYACFNGGFFINCYCNCTSVTIINPNPEALEITTTDHTCTWLQPWQTVKGTTTAHILQTAQQNSQYTFQIQIAATCQKPCPHTRGYWKHQFSAYLCKNGKTQTPPTTLKNYLNKITTQSKIFTFTGTQTQKFQQALNTLKLPIYSSMETKLKAQLLALWLNHVAGCTEGYKIKGLTASQIIQGSENALLKHQTNKYEYWKNLCNKFNNLW